MKKFLVGGAVRDSILGNEIKDFDFVIFNCSEQSLIDKGFQLIKKDIKVFMDPATGHQYAFPRKEIKTGNKYTDFIFDYNNVSLEDDLYRRDFTINAMARDEESGLIIDPYNGQEDLKNKVLRHVSEKFSEDPLRVIRGFRFMSNLGLAIAPDTLKLFNELKGELKHISNGRIVLELSKVNDLYNFLSLLNKYSFLETLFPEAKILPSPEKLSLDNVLMYLYSHSSLMTKELMMVYGFPKDVVNNTQILSSNSIDFNLLFKKLKIDRNDVAYRLFLELLHFRGKDSSLYQKAYEEIKNLNTEHLVQMYSGKELGDKILLKKEEIYHSFIK